MAEVAVLVDVDRHLGVRLGHVGGVHIPDGCSFLRAGAEGDNDRVRRGAERPDDRGREEDPADAVAGDYVRPVSSEGDVEVHLLGDRDRAGEAVQRERLRLPAAEPCAQDMGDEALYRVVTGLVGTASRVEALAVWADVVYAGRITLEPEGELDDPGIFLVRLLGPQGPPEPPGVAGRALGAEGVHPVGVRLVGRP